MAKCGIEKINEGLPMTFAVGDYVRVDPRISVCWPPRFKKGLTVTKVQTYTGRVSSKTYYSLGRYTKGGRLERLHRVFDEQEIARVNPLPRDFKSLL